MDRQLVSIKDFRQGYNDTADPDMLEDNELLKATNIDLSENGGWSTRLGTEKFNENAFNGTVSDGFEWIVNNESRKMVVINNELCWIKEDGSKVVKATLNDDEVGWLAINKKLYVGDGTEIFVWGDYDYDAIEGTITIKTNDIVRTDSGYFYKALSNHGSTNLITEVYTNISKWEDVTDVEKQISNIVRPIKAHDPSVKEEVKLEITSPVTKDGSIKISLDDVEKSINVNGDKEKLTYTLSGTATEGSISIVIDDNVYSLHVFASESSNDVASRMASYAYTGYDVSSSNNVVTFEAKECGEKGSHSFDKGNTGLSCSINVVKVGDADSQEEIATKIRAESFTNWDVSGSKAEVLFKSKVTGIKKDGYFDSNETGVAASMTVEVQGEEDNCDLTPIKKCKMFVMNPENLRVFASGNPDDPTALYYSEYNHFEYFKSISALYPITAEKEVRGLAVLLDHVLVSYTNVWYHWKGIDPDDAVWKPLPILVGAMNHKAIAITPFSITYVSDYGLHNVNAGILYEDALVINNTKLLVNMAEGRFTNLIKNIEHPETVRLVYNKDRLLLAYGDDSVNPRNNKILVYKWNTKGVSIYEGWEVNTWLPTFDGELFFCTKNYILKTGQGYTDIDAETGVEKAIVYEVETKDSDLKNPFTNKYLYNLFVAFKQYDDAEPQVDISLIADYITVSFEVSIVDSLVWGRKWGLRWGWVNALVKRFQINKKALRYRVRFCSDVINSPVTCYGIGFDYEILTMTPIALTEDEGRLLK